MTTITDHNAANRTLTVCSLTRSIIEVRELQNYNNERRPRKLWYNRKTPHSRKILKRLIFFMYETRKRKRLKSGRTSGEGLYFVTLTTSQHKTNKTDSELYASINRWLKDRSYRYVCVAERQADTQDLHFHLVIRRFGKFDINAETARLSSLFGVQPHPSVFDVKRASTRRKVAAYITKYFKKEGQKYSSLFLCRTFSCSNLLRKEYKLCASNYVTRLQSADGTIQQLIDRIAPLHAIAGTDFFVSYEYFDNIATTAREIAARKQSKPIEDTLKV